MLNIFWKVITLGGQATIDVADKFDVCNALGDSPLG